MMLQVYGSLLLTLFIGGVAVWGWLSWRLFFRLPILPREPRYDVPWGLVDLLLAFALYLLLSFAAVGVVRIEREPVKETKDKIVDEVNGVHFEKELTLHGWRTMIALDSGIKLLVMVLVIIVIAVRSRATAVDFGLTLTNFVEDLRIGGLTFLGIYLPMIALQAALVHGLEWKYDHPLIKSVTETKDLLLFTLAGLAAAVVAPLFEELVFRGLLQGWLEKLFAGRATGEQIVTGGRDDFDVPVFDAEAAAELHAAEPKPTADFNPSASHHSPSKSNLLAVTHGLNGYEWLAVILSTLVFSLLHYSHGPAWIPLLIFGAALGFVYQRTHRLWPGIFAHMLLNGVTMFGLWVQVFDK